MKIKSATIQGKGKYIYIEFKLKDGSIEPARTLAGEIKCWAIFDTAIKYLKSKGLKSASVDFENYDKRQEGLL